MEGVRKRAGQRHLATPVADDGVFHFEIARVFCANDTQLAVASGVRAIRRRRACSTAERGPHIHGSSHERGAATEASLFQRFTRKRDTKCACGLSIALMCVGGNTGNAANRNWSLTS